jgi:hypothetical protein
MPGVKVLELCTMGKAVFFRWLSVAFDRSLLYIDILAGALSIVGWLASWGLDIAGTLGFLLWSVPLSVLVTSVIAGSVYAVISLAFGDISRAAVAGVEPGAARTAQPHIRFIGWETIETRLAKTGSGEEQIGSTPWLTRVTFANEPEVTSTGLTAYKVSGHVEFYDAARDRFLFGMVGQWSDSVEDGIAAISEKQIDVLPDATPRHLDIALKYDEDDECYGINADTAVRAPTDLRDEQRKLAHGLYTIKIMVHGENVAETFWFGLINRGSGQRVRILRISS